MRWPIKKSRPLNRPEVVTPGWVPSKDEEEILARVRAVQRRVRQDALKHIPGIVKGERLFEPSTAVESVDVAYNTAPYNVNYILRSGQTYDIEVPYNNPGIFVVRGLAVTLKVRIVETNGVSWQTVTYPGLTLPNATSIGATTQKIWDTNTNYLYNRSVGFFWNLEDPRSGRKYADDLVPDLHLAQGSRLFADGGNLTLHAPLVLERDGQLTFKFRPVTDLVQRDANAGGQAYTTDLENGKRNNALKVTVELIGTRYFTDQDMLRKGATVP